MKKKIVRQLYKEAAEKFTPIFRHYQRMYITFEDLLLETARTLQDEKERMYWEYVNGKLIYEEYILINERLTDYLKREIKNACKA